MADNRSTPAENAPPTVLIVEDEVDVAELYEMWLADDYDVRVAHNGSGALSELTAAVDVVLLDRRMPGISGDEVLEEIRAEAFDCRVAIISAVTPDFDVIEMGFDDYLTKPVDRQDVLDAIERMVRRSQYDENLQEFYQLAATRAALQETKSDAELHENEQYLELESEISEKRTEMDEMVTAFEGEDFEAAFRQFENDY